MQKRKYEEEKEQRVLDDKAAVLIQARYKGKMQKRKFQEEMNNLIEEREKESMVEIQND